MAVYLVEGKDGSKRLVETRTKASAINHVSNNDYKATALNTSELVKHIQAGIEVENTGPVEETPILDTVDTQKQRGADAKAAAKSAEAAVKSQEKKAA